MIFPRTQEAISSLFSADGLSHFFSLRLGTLPPILLFFLFYIVSSIDANWFSESGSIFMTGSWRSGRQSPSAFVRGIHRYSRANRFPGYIAFGGFVLL
jgi:hypothetical protein